jgi:hypothetical protein
MHLSCLEILKTKKKKSMKQVLELQFSLWESCNTHFCQQVPKVYNWGKAPSAQGRYEGENPKALK